MKAMHAYSIKADNTLAVRAFYSKRGALSWGNGQHIFTNPDELANSRLSSEDARRVYYAVTGKPINVSERQLLAEMVFNAIKAAKLDWSDKGIDAVITCSAPEAAPVVASKAPKVKKMTEEVAEKKAEKKERKFARSPNSRSEFPCEAFGVHPDSNRAKALSRMAKKLNTQFPVEELVIAVYGTNERGNVSSFTMVMKGLISIQANNELRFEIRKEKNEKGISYGLYTR